MAISSLVAVQARAVADSISLNVPGVYLPDLPVLVRVEIQSEDGRVNRDVWDAEATLEAEPTDIVLSTNRVVLRNGLGSALVAFAGGGDLNLTIAVKGLEAMRSLKSLSGASVSLVGGTLPGDSTTWRGLVRITNSVTVPAGHVLTIESNTLVLIDGVASGTSGTDIVVRGSIQSLGTETCPVSITCGNPGRRWGQVRHDHAEPSTYRHTAVTLGGRAPGEGHTGTGPVIRATGSTILFDRCSLTDQADSSGTPGKIMQADDSDITFVDCLLARARMGPEISGTALWCTNTWIMEMRGPDDADGIYIHSQEPGQVTALAQCVVAGGDDDALDTLGSDVTVTDCIIRDWSNPAEDAKGISVFHGTTTVRRSLVVNCTDGVSAKSSGPLAVVNMEQCTVVSLRRGVAVAYKDNAAVGNVDFRSINSILRAPDAVHSDFGPEKLTLAYCNASTNWPGPNNFTNEPLFLDAATNFHLHADSPCVDAGDPALPLDRDWTRADVGAFPVFQTPIAPMLSLVDIPSNDIVLLHAGPDLRWASEVQASTNCVDWMTVAPLPLTNGPVEWQDTDATSRDRRFYRIRMGGAFLQP